MLTEQNEASDLCQKQSPPGQDNHKHRLTDDFFAKKKKKITICEFTKLNQEFRNIYLPDHVRDPRHTSLSTRLTDDRAPGLTCTKGRHTLGCSIAYQSVTLSWAPLVYLLQPLSRRSPVMNSQLSPNSVQFWLQPIWAQAVHIWYALEETGSKPVVPSS